MTYDRGKQIVARASQTSGYLRAVTPHPAKSSLYGIYGRNDIYAARSRMQRRGCTRSPITRETSMTRNVIYASDATYELLKRHLGEAAQLA